MERSEDKTATILPFPASRQHRLVRETVDVLLKRNGPAADRFWKTTINRLTGQLQCSGILDQAQINTQLESFSIVVFDMIRASSKPGDATGGGAA